MLVSPWTRALPAKPLEKNTGKPRLHHDLLLEDPYVVVITYPCGPWGNWSRFNLAKGGVAAETVENLREQGRSALRAVNKTVKDRINASRHVFLEQPRGSQSHDEPEMKKVKRLLEEGKLTKIHVDGCVVGHYDAESKLPHGKPNRCLQCLQQLQVRRFTPP